MDTTSGNKSLTFESEKGTGENNVQWSYRLSLNSNKKFHLEMHLIQQDGSREDYDYDGDYSATYTRGEYIFSFSNVMRSGSRRSSEQSNPEPVAPSAYDKTLSALLPERSSLIVKKDKYEVKMQMLQTATCVDFLDAVFPECMVDTAGEWESQFPYAHDDEWDYDKTTDAKHTASGCFSYGIPGYYITIHKRGQYFVHNFSGIHGKCKYCGEDTN